MTRRLVADQVRHTLQGKAATLLLLVAMPSLWQLLRGGTSEKHVWGSAAGAGALLVAHLITSVNLVLFVPPLVAKRFTTKREDEPMLAFPYAYPTMAGYRLVVDTLLVSALYLAAVFYLFHGRSLAAVVPSATGLVAHSIGMVGYLMVLGMVAALGTRAWLRGPRASRRAAVLVRLGALLSLVSLLAVPFVPRLLLEHAAAELVVLNQMAARSAFLLQLPLALALSTGHWGSFAGWAVLLVALLAVALRAVGSWSADALADLTRDSIDEPARTYPSRFSPQIWPRQPAARLALLFFRKDVLTRYLREPWRYLVEQYVIVTIGLVLVALGRVFQDRDMVSSAVTSSLVVAAVMGASAAAAAMRGLPALGEEGEQLALLRPLVPGAALFAAKCTAVTCFAATHALLYSAFLGGAAISLGVEPPSFLALGSASVLMAGIFSLLASALGFLLPELRREGLRQAGSSGIARVVYTASAALPVSMAAGLYWFQLQYRPKLVYLMEAFSLAALPVLAMAALAAVWAIQRLPKIEL